MRTSSANNVSVVLYRYLFFIFKICCEASQFKLKRWSLRTSLKNKASKAVWVTNNETTPKVLKENICCSMQRESKAWCESKDVSVQEIVGLTRILIVSIIEIVGSDDSNDTLTKLGFRMSLENRNHGAASSNSRCPQELLYM